jgi:hypothetical protein
VIISTGKTFYDKEKDKVYCSIEWMDKNRIRKIGFTLNHLTNEIIAKQYLWDLGLEPNKCRKKGYPDFKCKDNIWVEVKTPNTCLNYNQIKKFKELLDQENRIFILFMHVIKNLIFLN